MKFAGINKNSFVDYPAKIATVLFTAGCSMNCWYCHNRAILSPAVEPTLSEEDAIAFLEKKRGKIDAVVLTGGEVTLQKDLESFICKLKDMGFLVKIDTNGTRPKVIKSLLEKNLVDYIAMDIKAPLDKYSVATCTKDDMNAIRESIDLIINSSIGYEFRTTFIPQLKTEDIVSIAKDLAGAKSYVLQQYVHRAEYTEYTNVIGFRIEPHSPEYIRATAEEVRKHLPNVATRGI